MTVYRSLRARASLTEYTSRRGSFPQLWLSIVHQPAAQDTSATASPGHSQAWEDSLPGPVVAVEVAFPIGCHPGLYVCVEKQGGVWPVGRRRTSASTDRQWHRSRVLRLPLRSPCRAKCPAVVAGLLDCRAAQGLRCLSRPAWRGKGASAAG